MTLETRPVGDRHAWGKMLSSHRMARSIVPLWDALAGWASHDLGLYRDGALVGGCTVALQRIPFTPLALGRINFLLFDSIEELQALLQGIDRFSLLHGAVETELRLRIPSTPVIEGFEEHAQIRETLENSGYRALAKADTTYFMRIDRSDEELLGSFKSEYRNRIRKAQKAKVVVEVTRDRSLLDPFAEAYVEMVSRKGAPKQPKDQVGSGLVPLLERGYAEIFVERYGDDFANMLIVDMLGIPVYALGTRSKAHVDGKMPGAAQVLHFEVMRILRERGHRWYDLGGCQGPVPIEGDPNYGTWRFKYGFRPEFVRFLPYFRKIRGPFNRALELAHRVRGDYV
jgi:hypothetical protein